MIDLKPLAAELRNIAGTMIDIRNELEEQGRDQAQILAILQHFEEQSSALLVTKTSRHRPTMARPNPT